MPNGLLRGEHEGAKLLDIAPALLDLAGYEIIRNRSPVSGILIPGAECETEA